jgi:hypothetical protein
MDADELAEMMAEPPGGENHGRVRSSGGWRSLEPIHTELDYIVPDPEYGKGRRRKDTSIPHGTRGGYTNHRCRCDLCRHAQREYIGAYRRLRHTS